MPHVLIVEDNALVVGALRVLLEASGFTVSAAAGVQDAVAVARSTRPEVMLLDLSLPDGDGLDVMASLGDAAPRLSVALTGHDAPEVRTRCLRAGCREVLVKPMGAAALPGQIRAWLAEQGASS